MAPPAPLRILLVDDTALNRRIVLGLLRRLGHQADVATTGAGAVEAIATGAYDLVLMDVEMPGMDGLEATRRLRSLPGPTPHVVALTGGAEGGDRQACLAAGMDDYLTKPVVLDSLAAALDRARPDRGAAGPAVAGAPVRRSSGPPVPDDEGLPVFDPGVARRLAEAMGERGTVVVAELVDMFLNAAPGKIEALRDGCHPTGSDVGEVRRAAHTLRSSAASLGALRLSAASGDVEAAVLAQDTASLPDLVAVVVSELASARPALEALSTELATARREVSEP